MAKQEAEDIYKREQIERYKLLEELKLKQEEEQLLPNQKKLDADEEYISLLKLRMENNMTECCICTDNIADTATIPCGHKSFCYSCINDYHTTNPYKGCPVCRKEIMMVTKIF